MATKYKAVHPFNRELYGKPIMKFLSDKEFFSLFKGEKVLDVHRC